MNMTRKGYIKYMLIMTLRLFYQEN